MQASKEKKEKHREIKTLSWPLPRQEKPELRNKSRNTNVETINKTSYKKKEHKQLNIKKTMKLPNMKKCEYVFLKGQYIKGIRGNAKNCQASEMQSPSTERYHLTPVKMAINKIITDNKYWWRNWKMKTLHIIFRQAN